MNDKRVLNMKNVFLRTVAMNIIFILRIFSAEEQQLKIPSSAHTTTVTELEKIALKPYFTKWCDYTKKSTAIKKLSQKNNNVCAAAYFEKWKYKYRYLGLPVSFKYCSSETTPGTIGSSIFAYISSCSPKNIIIANDQVTHESFLDQVLGLPGIVLTIITSDSHPTTNTTLKKTKYTGRITHHAIAGNANKSGKMHNKFMVIDNTTVITGSPNCTLSGYNNNIESFVIIINKYVAYLYQAYARYICSGKDKYDSTQPEYQHVERMLKFFNASQNTLQVCLAPIINIGKFIPHFFQQVSILRMSMFVLSNNSPPPDIMKELEKIVQSGTTVSIKVDKGEFDKKEFVQKALQPFIDKGQQVETVRKHPAKGRDRDPLLHDKLILIEQKDGTKFVIIGSAGFSTNVQQNLNLENMVMISLPEAHTFFSAHFNALVSGPTMTVEQRK